MLQVVRLRCARSVRARQHRERFGYYCVFSVYLDPSFLVSEHSSVLATLEEPVGTWVERVLKIMSSSSGEEVPVEEVTQEVREQQLVNRFDLYTVQNGPQKGAVILRFLGFGVVSIVEIDPDQARVGDIAVKVVYT